MIFKTKKISFYYEKYGNNTKTIVILPGWGNTRKTFDYFIYYLMNYYTIYILDYPGFGLSNIPKEELTLDDYSISIKKWFEKEKIINPIIIAHSFGGRITALLVTKYNIKVDRILLIDVAGIKRRKTLKIFLKEKIYKFLKKIRVLLPKKLQKKYLSILINYFSSNDYKELPSNMKKTFQNIINLDLKNYYQKINNKVLIIWGKDDQDTPLKDAYLLNKIIKNSECIIYQKASHYSYLKYPYLTLNIIISFCKEKE